ncbi:hypothetical protein [Streptomyces sp. NPDC059063]|uniref:hypothetical protein n=1 Tax=unclassified Streptomyces TaxID=2593676 RepID=UPI0036874AE4
MAASTRQRIGPDWPLSWPARLLLVCGAALALFGDPHGHRRTRGRDTPPRLPSV